jgi:hypothetical protein
LIEVVKLQFTYIKDTRHFLQLYEGSVLSRPGFLVALDINSMYTEIPLDEAETCVMDSLYQSGIVSVSGVGLPPSAQLKVLLHTCLYRNDFMFDNVHYLQVRGVPMGSKFSPEVADIVGFVLERRIFAMYDDAIRWSRFRDDCFLCFRGTREQLDSFLAQCNEAHDTLKFKFEISDTSVPFLDTEVFRGMEGDLRMKPYRKPAYAFQYLHRQSAHPPSVFKSFIKGELCRLARNSSDEADFVGSCAIFYDKLLCRGYSTSDIAGVAQSFDYASSRHSQLARPAVPMAPKFSQMQMRALGQLSWQRLLLTLLGLPVNLRLLSHIILRWAT